MKKMILALASILVFYGCGSSAYIPFKTAKVMYSLKNNPKVYNIKADSTLGEEVNDVIIKFGDSLRIIGEDVGMTSYSVIDYPKNKYYIDSKYLGSLCKLKITMQTLTFAIPKEKNDIAWGRAVNFVQSNSDMKIQTQSDYLIQTFNPVGEGLLKGFTITKEPTENNILISVSVRSNNPYYDSYYMAQKCAYYINYGDNCDDD